jgi:hypothetical protein
LPIDTVDDVACVAAIPEDAITEVAISNAARRILIDLNKCIMIIPYLNMV